MTTIIFRDGNWEKSALLEATHEVLTGQGLFETILVKDQVPQFLDLHLARLLESSEILGIPCIDSENVMAGIDQLLALHQGELGRLRITLYGGVSSPQLMLSLTGVNPTLGKVNVCIAPWTRNENSVITGAKSASYAENAFALDWAKERSFTETLFFNNAGELAEAATANIVIVVDGKALTPPLSSGCLPGITRQILVDEGVITEITLNSGSLERASAAALLSSIRGVQPINVMAERKLNPRDETLEHLAAVYEARVSQDKENWAKIP